MGRVAATKKKSKRFDGYADARRRRRRRGAIATANENDRKRARGGGGSLARTTQNRATRLTANGRATQG